MAKLNGKQQTRQLVELLRIRHPAPEWATFTEMAIATGYAPSRIDFYAMNVWRSKKFLKIAYEIKVSRADFARELKDRSKRRPAELLANECYFVTPAGLVKPDEVPEGWGLVAQTKGGLRKTKHAKYREADVTSELFVASLARRSADHEKSEWPAVFWARAGEEISEEQLRNLVKEKSVEYRSEVRQKERDRVYKTLATARAIKAVVSNKLGWRYADHPDRFAAWLDENISTGPVELDANTRLLMRQTAKALNDILASEG